METRPLCSAGNTRDFSVHSGALGHRRCSMHRFTRQGRNETPRLHMHSERPRIAQRITNQQTHQQYDTEVHTGSTLAANPATMIPLKVQCGAWWLLQTHNPAAAPAYPVSTHPGVRAAKKLSGGHSAAWLICSSYDDMLDWAP
jgi:hypothetical protein